MIYGFIDDDDDDNDYAFNQYIFNHSLCELIDFVKIIKIYLHN